MHLSMIMLCQRHYRKEAPVWCYFWVCLGGCLLMRLVSEPVNTVKQMSSVSGLHPAERKGRRQRISFWLSACLALNQANPPFAPELKCAPSVILVLRPFRLGLNPTAGFPGYPGEDGRSWACSASKTEPVPHNLCVCLPHSSCFSHSIFFICILPYYIKS